MSYRVTKTYGHELGLSACFRQWRADSHCRFLHGYALAFKFVFEADTLDDHNWVMDFGGLKSLKSWLCNTFDHKLLIAADDPARERLEALMPFQEGTIHGGDRDGQKCRMYTIGDPAQLADVQVVEAVGCEAFARMAWDFAQNLLTAMGHEVEGVVPDVRTAGLVTDRVRLVEVECREHAGNAASYMGE